MRIQLVLCNAFESDFQGKHYFIYQFVDPNTLTLLSLSSEENLNLKEGKDYMCTLSVKRSKLVVSNVLQ